MNNFDKLPNTLSNIEVKPAMHEVLGIQHSIISELIDVRAIKKNRFKTHILDTVDSGIIINNEILNEFADQYFKDNQEKYDEIFPNDIEKSARKTIRTFVKGSILTAEDALVIGKNLRPSRIHVDRKSNNTYVQPTDEVLNYFSGSDEKWKGIETQDKMIFGDYSRPYRMTNHALQLADIKIDDIDEFVEQGVFAHEYGHFWHNMISRVKALKDKSTAISDNEKVIHYSAELLSEIKNIFPLDMPEFGEEKVGNYYNPHDIQNTSIMYSYERISAGFELAFLRQTLIDRQVPFEKIELFLKSFSEEFSCLSEAFLVDYNACSNNGLKYINVVNALYSNARRIQSDTQLELYKRIRGPKEVGYAFGLSHDQLKYVLSQNSLDPNNI